MSEIKLKEIIEAYELLETMEVEPRTWELSDSGKVMLYYAIVTEKIQGLKKIKRLLKKEFKKTIRR